MVVMAISCATSKKLASIKEKQIAASISMQDNVSIPKADFSSDESNHPHRDTLSINIDGRQMLIMKAIRDEESGDMVATEQITAAVVTARFRNVAERHGKVDLQFDVCAPEEMRDSKWQIRLSPEMYVMGDTINLDRIIITGKEYRKAQLRGYQQYEKFLSRIIEDPDHFIDRHSLETFLQRNIPEVFSYRNDSTFVSDSLFESSFGVTNKQALEHYTNKIAVYFNDKRRLLKNAMYLKYVKAPFQTKNIRLDTVMVDQNGDFHYLYTQTINVTPGLRKAEMTLSGSIFEQDKKLYSIPESDMLTFYISSLSSLVDSRERYLTTIVERKVSADASWNIDFELGGWQIKEELGNNLLQIGEIKKCFVNLIKNEEYDIDSITVAAFASPEGPFILNEKLSRRRAESALSFFQDYLEYARDSIRKDLGFFISVGKDMKESAMSFRNEVHDISFKSSASGENWTLLDHIMAHDTKVSDSWRAAYEECSKVSDPDSREQMMKKQEFYPYVKEEIYPLLRTVQFKFCLHRKGMVKDTVHTTVLDSVYMKGTQAIRDRDYETAVNLLMPYEDFNTAIAFASLDRNISALNILNKLERTAAVNYMLALVYSRLCEDEKAVQFYLESCQQDASFIHRGNLDPEISELIKHYKLNNEQSTYYENL